MPLPNPDPSIGPSWTLCVGDTWRPPIVGLLEEMCDTGYWEQYFEKWGVLPDYALIEDYKSGAARIIGRIGINALDEGCTDLEPSTVPPSYGTQYSKHYSFVASNVPTGWTVIRGTPESSGLRCANFHATTGWHRRVTAQLALVAQCHAVQYLHTVYMNASPVGVNQLFSGGFMFSGNARTYAQMDQLPEAGTWNLQLNSTLQAANSNQVLTLVQVDDLKTNSADLLGDCWLQSVDVIAYSPSGNPFP